MTIFLIFFLWRFDFFFEVSVVHDDTWEDIAQLIEDAPYRVRNYLAENATGHPPLQKVYDAAYE